MACENHQFIAYINRDRKSICKSIEKDEVCRFCIAVKFAVKDRATKVCMLQLPQNMKDKIMPSDVFLRDNIFPCESFFVLTASLVSISIDNPVEKYIFSEQTD